MLAVRVVLNVPALVFHLSYTVVMLLYGHVIDDVRERHNYK